MGGYDDFYWTLEQVIAWIMLRERGPVEQTSVQALEKIKSGDHIREYHDRHGSRMTPYFVACHNPLAKLLPGFADFDIDNKDRYTRELVDALRRGEVVANAWLRREETRRPIEPLYWLDRAIGCDELGLLSDRGPPPRHASNLADVRIEATGVRRRWPEPSRAAKSALNAEEEAFERLCKMMAESPDKPPGPKRTILKDMRPEVSGLSEPIFNRAWLAALKRVRPIGWGKSGRPKKEGSEIAKAKLTRQ